MSDNRSGPNYVIGYNMPGYLPEMDPWITSDHDAAKRSLIDDMLRHADDAAEIGDEDEATELSHAAEDLNLISDGAEWGTIIGNTSYWLSLTDEAPEEEDYS